MPNESSSKFALLDQLAEEFAARYRKGERPALQEYIDRHPDLADQIREFFPAVVEIEQVEADGHPSSQTPPLRKQVGDYAVLREIGRGGMGVVYEAEQQSLGRRVALKVLPVSVSKDEKALERFRREARAAAKLHHTNIVPVFEVGQDGDVCFYAMQFIQGQPLDEVINELRWLRHGSTAQGTAARGAVTVSFGAQSLFTGQFRARAATTPINPNAEVPEPEQPSDNTERSLVRSAVLPGQTGLSSVESNRKPFYQSVARIGQQVANALTYAHQRGIIHRDIKPSNLLLDAAGVVWVTDFGLAKTEESSLTEAGEVLGTLRYLAPERFRLQCDVRSDVYALGLTLYELLVLRPAFDSADRLQLIELIPTQEPARPRSLDPHIPRDLETIVLKATDKDPGRRYQTAEEMAHDLQRFLDEEPIKARRASVSERVSRWCRRHPAVASLSAVVAALVLIVAVVASAAALRLSAALSKSEQHRIEADRNLWEAYLARAHAGRMSRRVGQRFDSLEAIKKALALPLPPGRSRDELRNEAIACLALPDLRLRQEVGRWTWPQSAVYIDIDGRHQRYAVADQEGNVSVRRVADDVELFPLPGFGFATKDFLVFSRDGGLLAVLAWPSGRTKLWRLEGPEPVLLAEFPSVYGTHTIACTPDGELAALGMYDGHIALVERATGHSRQLPHQFPGLTALALHPDGRQLAVARTDKGRSVLSVHTLDETRATATLELPADVHHVTWHPHGRGLAASCEDSRIYLWEVGQPRPLGLESGRGVNLWLEFSPTGDVLVSCGWEWLLRFWDPLTGQQMLNQPAGGNYLRFSPDGRFIPLAGRNTHFQIAEFTRREYRTLVSDPTRGKGEYWAAAVSPDGRLLAVGMKGGVRLWDLNTGDEVAHLDHLGWAPSVSFDSEGRLLTYGPAGLLRWSLRPEAAGSIHLGPPETLHPVGVGGMHADQSRDGRVMAFTGFQGGARLRHEETPSRLIQLGPQTDVRNISVSPDGRWVVTPTFASFQPEGTKLWEAASGKLVRALSDDNRRWTTFSPDGRWLAVNSLKGCTLWEVSTWTVVRTTPGWGIAFTADGEKLAVTEGHTLRLLHPASGREFARLEDPNQDRAEQATFTPDGARLITTGGDSQSIHVWDLQLIRQGLEELNLDWDAPELPPAPESRPPLRVTVDYGNTLPKLLADRLVRRSQQHLANREVVKALEALREAVRIDAQHPEAHNSLAWLLLTGPAELRAAKDSLPLARRAVALASEQATYHNTLGIALYRNNQLPEAITELEKSLQLGRGEYPAHDLFFLAMCHHRQGDAAKAKDCRERANRWFDEHRGKLAADAVAELMEFQAETEAVLAKPGDKPGVPQ